MAYLIEQLFGWLFIVGVLCALSGWAWHLMQSAPELESLEREREKLRHDLVSLAAHGAAPGDGALVTTLEADLDTARTRADIAASRVNELERAIAQLRDQHEDDLGRIAELERALDRAQAPSEGPVMVAQPIDDEAARQGFWRARYMEARVAHLENLPPPAPDHSAIEALQAELVAARQAGAAAQEAQGALRARLAELEQAVQAARAAAEAERARAARLVDPAPLTHELNQLKWRARYFAARTEHLEAQEPPPPPQPAPADVEAQKRAQWRLAYLEERLAHLQAAPAPVVDTSPLEAQIATLQAAEQALQAQLAQRAAAIAALEAQLRAAHENLGALPALRARITELEATLAQERAIPKADPQAGQWAWRQRYLTARVEHLEEALKAAARPAPPAPPPMPAAPAPTPPPAPTPAVAEVRPESLPAPRSGVPDDLRLIEGIGPKVESTLNSLGVYHFDQIANWTAANIAWVDQYLRFKGRISRENWVAQAERLHREGVGGARALENEFG